MSASGPGGTGSRSVAVGTEDRYRAFLRSAAEAICCFEMEEPIPISLPPHEQVRLIFRRSRLAECNDAMARMYGYESCEELFGTRLPDMLVESDPENVACLRRFVESGYRLVNEEMHERDRGGNCRYFLNDLVGIVDDGLLLRAWGTQRDITPRKTAEEAERRQAAGMQATLERYAALERRLTLLTAASGRLIATVERDRLTREIVDLGIELVHADAIAIWQRHGTSWRVEAHSGLSREFVDRLVEQSTPAFPLREPLLFSDVFAVPELAGRYHSYRHEGIRSMVVAPLRIADELIGTVAFYSKSTDHFTEVDTRTAAALANLAASALHNSMLYEERRTAEERARFLAEAGSLLASTFDVEATLTRITQLAVPRICDWASVHLMRADGAIEQLAIAHVNRDKVRWAEELRRKFPVRAEEPSGIADVIRTARPQLIDLVQDEALLAVARGPEHLEVLRALELRSALVVPLRRADRAFGAISLVTTAESGRRLGPSELSLAEALAARAALAIDNARLYREAREANQLKDQFIATLSHELRTPLNALLGWSKMLGDGVLDEAGTARALQAIQRNAQAQAQLVGDILELSRILSGKIELTVEPVELGSLITEIVETLQPTFEAKSLTVETVVARSLVVMADRSRLQQVVLNLLTNAVKFTPEGGLVKVTGGLNQGFAELLFEDTGVGISPEFLPHVFERFRQGEPSTSRAYGGLGIGLSVCRHLLELHQGSIAAHSDGVGRGATFIVRLLVDANAGEQP